MVRPTRVRCQHGTKVCVPGLINGGADPHRPPAVRGWPLLHYALLDPAFLREVLAHPDLDVNAENITCVPTPTRHLRESPGTL